MRRLALAVLGVVVIACGSHVGEDGGSAGRAGTAAALERDLPDLLSGAKVPIYSATYELKSVAKVPSASGARDIPPITLTYISRPPDFRFDEVITLTTSIRVSAISRPGATFYCGDFPGSTPRAVCYRVSPEQAKQLAGSLGAGSPLEQMRKAYPSLAQTGKSQERILGRDAYCYRYTQGTSASPSPSLSATEIASVDICLTAAGAPLRASYTINAASSSLTIGFEATAFSETVADADFDLPFPESTVPFLFPTAPQQPAATPRTSVRPSPTR